METKLGWYAVFIDGRTVSQYPKKGVETPIAFLGKWDNFRLSLNSLETGSNLIKKFMVGKSGVNAVDGSLCLAGKWYPAMPGTIPMKLIYYRKMSASLNGGAGIHCQHYVGYEQDTSEGKITIQLCVPDDGGKPSVYAGDIQFL